MLHPDTVFPKKSVVTTLVDMSPYWLKRWGYMVGTIVIMFFLGFLMAFGIFGLAIGYIAEQWQEAKKRYPKEGEVNDQ